MKKRTSKKATPAKAAPATPKTVEGGVPLKRICADLGIPADFATREILRRRWRSEDPGATKGHVYKDRWTFDPKDVPEVKKILAARKERLVAKAS